MLHALDDYYIKDCGVISAQEVTQWRTNSNDQFVILTTVSVAFMLVRLQSLRKHTLVFLFKQARMVVHA
jgi:hypothetical protein